ncbi:MAG: hypothetical protein ABFE07_24120 [Armatimonadia bacterium]
MTKRIVIHFEDETGASVCSQPRKRKPSIGDVLLLNGRPYAVLAKRDSSTSLDFYAKPDRAPVEYELDGIVHG